MTKFRVFVLTLFLVLAGPAWVGAVGFEAAVGVWHQGVSGDISYKGRSAQDELNLDDNLGLDDETGIMFRARLDTPILLPNIAFMATPVTFNGKGLVSHQFTFGDETFAAEVELDGNLKLNQYDISLFYGIPGLKTATAGMFNVDLGLNLRLIDVSAEIRQEQTGLSVSESYLAPVPTLYAGASLRPFDFLAFEAEARGMTFANNHFYSLLGRIRVAPIDHFFIAGGYRFDSVSIDEKGLKTDIDLSGPFAEIGFSF